MKWWVFKTVFSQYGMGHLIWMGHIQLNLRSNDKQQERECPNQRQAPAQQAIIKTGKLICKTEKETDTDVQNRLWDSVGEGEGGMFRENSIETCILSRVKQITSPGWMHETSARTWCTGKTQRDGMGREAGGGIGMGNTCKSMADSCRCMAKTTIL